MLGIISFSTVTVVGEIFVSNKLMHSDLQDWQHLVNFEGWSTFTIKLIQKRKLVWDWQNMVTLEGWSI